jgi:hypothetical protein
MAFFKMSQKSVALLTIWASFFGVAFSILEISPRYFAGIFYI